MKKYLLTLMSVATVMMFAACSTDNSNDDGYDENPKAGTDGFWCWKVTTQVTENLTQVEYMWNTELDVITYVNALKQTGLNITYEKSGADDKLSCDEANKAADKQNLDDIEGLFDYKKHYENFEPGIYMRDNELLAKGTDGCTFHIPDVTDLASTGAMMGTPIYPVAFTGWDGKNTTYSFTVDYYNDNDGNLFTYTYEDTVFTVIKTEYSPTSTNILYSTETGAAVELTNFFDITGYEKIADASDFENTYVAIAKLVQKGGPIVKPSEMVPQYTKYLPSGWMSELYPSDMETAKYVFPYTGKGDIQSMAVSRTFQWGLQKEGLWLPRFCQTDDVHHIEAIFINADESDVRAYIAKLRDEGFYTRIIYDLDTDEMVTFSVDSFNYDEEHAEELEGKPGYIYPSIEVTYVKNGGMLTIKFEVAKVGFV